MELLLDKNKSIDIAIKIAKELNQKNLFIPVLDGFEVKENLRNGFVASNSHGIIEKYVFEDGTFDDINKSCHKKFARHCSKKYSDYSVDYAHTCFSQQFAYF